MTDLHPSASPARVLVTGSAGAIGRVVAATLLARGHYVRGFDRRSARELVPGLCDERLGELTDRAAVRDAVAGMDTIVHLAATTDDADFLDALLGPNVIGLFHVFDAAREAKVRRVILASTIQAVSGHDWHKPGGLRIEDGPAPTNHYGLTKAWAEIMARMYWQRFKLSTIAVRIGWYTRNHRERDHCAQHAGGQRVYLSHRDAARFFTRCVETPGPPGPADPPLHAVLFATSRSPDHPVVDLEPARRLIGYEPRDVFPEGCGYDEQGVVRATAWE